jgi:hypothetical protein
VIFKPKARAGPIASIEEYHARKELIPTPAVRANRYSTDTDVEKTEIMGFNSTSPLPNNIITKR